MGKEKGIVVITEINNEIHKEYMWGYRAEDYLNNLRPPEEKLSKTQLEIMRKLKLYT